MQDFHRSIQRVNEIIQFWQSKRDERYAHLDRSDIDKVRKIVQEKQKWYEQTIHRFHALRQQDDPSVLCSQIRQEQEVSSFN